MENASEALKMAAAVLIFVGALSIAIVGFTKAKQSADAVMGNSGKKSYYSTENVQITSNRVVGIETIIPTLYSYFKEGYTILFYTGTATKDANGNFTDEVTNIKPLTIYYSEALPSKLASSFLLNTSDGAGHLATFEGKNYNRAIYGLDANDEATRQEPWVSDEIHAKMFIQSILYYNTSKLNSIVSSGIDDSIFPSYTMSRSKFSGSPNHAGMTRTSYRLNFEQFVQTISGNGNDTPIVQATKARFIERSGTYNLTTNVSDNTTVDSSVISFSNDQTIANDEGTQKRVIQYILVQR